MSQKSPRKNHVVYSDEDDDRVVESPPRVVPKSKGIQRSDDDAASSDISFINDEAEDDEEDDSGSGDIQSRGGHVQLRHSTPPVQRRRPVKYQVDSDEEDENIPESLHYQADDPASPKKKRTLANNKLESRRTAAIPENDDDHLSSQRNKGANAHTSSHRHDEPSEKEVDEHQSRRSTVKGRQVDDKTTVAVSAKKLEKLDFNSDSELEIIEHPKSPSKSKANKRTFVDEDLTPKKTPGKSPRKKAVPKSKVYVDNSDEDLAVAASKLAPGDSMYPEKKSSKVQPANLKRALQVTPPYNTRASSAAGEQATPSKKPRKVRNESTFDASADQELDSGPVKKGNARPPNNEVSEKGNDSNLPGLVKIEDLDDDDQAENDVFEPVHLSKAQHGSKSSKQLQAPVVINQKYSDRRWSALPRPSKCEVYDKNMLDVVLDANNSYEQLVPLRYCDIQNSSSPFAGTLTGTIRWSAWYQVFPKFEIDCLVPLLEFQREGRFVNLSCVDPSEIAGRYMSETRHELTVGDQTAICITIGSVRDSALAMTASLGGPYITRGVRMVFHSYEWERWGCTIGEIARRPELKTQVWNSAVTFGTRLIRREDGPSSTTRKSETLPASFFNPYQSPKKQSSTSARVSLPNFVGQLEFTDEIPVYDARTISKNFKWSATVFENPESYFRRYDLFNNGGEIPSNALCAVGYVTHVYHMLGEREGNGGKGKGKAKDTDEEPQELRIAPLIQWIYVLGTLSG